ncbi:lasso RiPP family leader peptide-containing protein [Actinosynnema sp. CS-041913]|uniref:lasso RiPP family leader peptide-containing protein n=1 Tax=Actinosynnema sp. CS-041913 TaxID=3239917 RepID=UPI003D89BEF4
MVPARRTSARWRPWVAIPGTPGSREELIVETKKTPYERPVLTEAGQFAQVTLGRGPRGRDRRLRRRYH